MMSHLNGSTWKNSNLMYPKISTWKTQDFGRATKMSFKMFRWTVRHICTPEHSTLATILILSTMAALMSYTGILKNDEI
jgi:hypothetical protein